MTNEERRQRVPDFRIYAVLGPQSDQPIKTLVGQAWALEEKQRVSILEPDLKSELFIEMGHGAEAFARVTSIEDALAIHGKPYTHRLETNEREPKSGGWLEGTQTTKGRQGYIMHDIYGGTLYLVPRS